MLPFYGQILFAFIAGILSCIALNMYNGHLPDSSIQYPVAGIAWITFIVIIEIIKRNIKDDE